MLISRLFLNHYELPSFKGGTTKRARAADTSATIMFQILEELSENLCKNGRKYKKCW